MMVAKLVSPGTKSWSINALAEELGIDRRTIKKRIGDTPPFAVVGGYPVWKLKDVVAAILGYADARNGKEFDPDQLIPKERLDHYRAEREKDKMMIERSEYVHADDVREQMADVVMICITYLETLPDILERDCCLEPEIIQDVENKIDGVRTAMGDALVD